MNFELIGYVSKCEVIGNRTVLNIKEVKSYKDENGDWKKVNQWFDVTIWKVQPIEEDSLVLIKGEVKKSNKDKVYYTNFIANQVYKLEKFGKEEKKEEVDLSKHQYEEVPF